MSPTRREVLLGLGGTTLAYALQVGCAPASRSDETLGAVELEGRAGGRPNTPDVDFRDWLVISRDGSVTVYTARTEIGQGLTTVLYNLVGQGLELPDERINVVLGDTDTCPSDGPTTGSAATQYVGWAFWIACHEIRADLILLAAEAMDLPAEELEYRAGEIISSRDPARKIGIGELADGRVRRMSIDVEAAPRIPAYVDRETLNVNAEAIVTGTQQYAADLYPEGCLYGGMLLPPYHASITNIDGASVEAARKARGVVAARHTRTGKVMVVGTTFSAVQRGLAAVDATWKTPDRPQELDNEAEIRAAAKLEKVVEDKGRPDAELAASDTVVSETYVTQYASQVPMETESAVAQKEDGRWVVRMGTQNPFRARYRVAHAQGLDEADVRVVAMPAGGAFGCKNSNIVGRETVLMAEFAGVALKHVYSRKDDIQRRSRYKESVVVDLTSAVAADGRLVARKIDFFQDEGHGSEDFYDIPNVQTRLYRTRMPTRHGTMRGTSYAQDIFAIESHTDMVAEAAGVDPLEFRRRNVLLREFLPVIDNCARLMNYPDYRPPADHGVGFAICNHGGRQLGAVGAEVRVDRESGRVEVLRLVGSFDVGVIINRNTAIVGIKGAMIWGLGYALLEEVRLDGHHCYTTGFTNYQIARMSDVPPIEVSFVNNVTPDRPRGCGEMPLPPTTAAIANAVYNAIGVRFYEIPITPERVKAALTPRQASSFS